MELLSKAFGVYETNCYILRTNLGEFIIDAGVDSSAWVCENVKNPLAILNTHGHFDHIWDNAKLRESLQIPIYCPNGDAFMLKNDCFDLGLTPCTPDFEVEPNEVLIFMASPQMQFKNDSRESQNLITRPPTPSAREGEIKECGALPQPPLTFCDAKSKQKNQSHEALASATYGVVGGGGEVERGRGATSHFVRSPAFKPPPPLVKMRAERISSENENGRNGEFFSESQKPLNSHESASADSCNDNMDSYESAYDEYESPDYYDCGRGIILMRPKTSSEVVYAKHYAIIVEFMHFPGHTPGCSVIKIKEAQGADESAYFFSGDFMFYRSIGRCDFPYSSPTDMKASLEKFGKIAYNATLYPGHGQSTTICDEQKNLQTYLHYI